MSPVGKPVFDPGQILMTPGVVNVLTRAQQKPSEFVLRHLCMDQGDLSDSDHRANLSAMRTGLRILNHYTTARGEALWLISEQVDVQAGEDPRKRILTTLLKPEDY